MKHLVLLLLCLLDLGLAEAQTYRNPVIPGFHPDPSVCRVGDTFYLVNSTFCYFPGVPLYESKDLVHWRQVGNVLNRESQLNLRGASAWTGIYAPTIRYNDGLYYMVTTNVGHGGNFFVTSTSPEGPWSEPVWLKQGGIDPSLYFEEGRCYLVSNPDEWITLCEIDPKTGEQLSESKRIWQGEGGRYPEGPHIYEKDGYYYLLISEGGTELNHHLTIARSRDIWGPYKPNPDNPILTNCNRLGENKQIQGTGHGDFVQASDGSWWLVFLAYRNFGGSYHHLGRETCLAPVTWEKGEWPVVNDGQPIDTLMTANLLPQHPYPAKPFEFGPDNPSWVFIQNPDSSKYQWQVEEQPVYNKDKKGRAVKRMKRTTKLGLLGSASSLSQNECPTFIGLRQESPNFALTTDVALEAEQVGDEGGLSIYQIHDGHFDFFVRHGEEHDSVVLRCKLKSLDVEVASEELASPSVRLRITSDGNLYRFSYSEDSDEKTREYKSLGELNCSLLSTEVAGGFTGVVLGMFAHTNPQDGEHNGSKTYFQTFEYVEKALPKGN